MNTKKFKEEYKNKLYVYLLKQSNLEDKSNYLLNLITKLLIEGYRDYVIDKDIINLCKNNRIFYKLKGVSISLVDLGLSNFRDNNYFPNDILSPNTQNSKYSSITINRVMDFESVYDDYEFPLPVFWDIDNKAGKRLVDYRVFSEDINKFPQSFINKLRTAFIDYCNTKYECCNFLREYRSGSYGDNFYSVETLEELRLISKDWYDIVNNFIKENEARDEFPNNYNIKKSLEQLKEIIEI